jgi:hypothetical protein
MGDSAPRLPRRLLDVVEVLSRRQAPIAEINRLVGAEAERLGLPRPNYETVRVLVHEARGLRVRQATVGSVLLDVATTVRSPWAYAELASRPPRERLRDRASD